MCIRDRENRAAGYRRRFKPIFVLEQFTEFKFIWRTSKSPSLRYFESYCLSCQSRSTRNAYHISKQTIVSVLYDAMIDVRIIFLFKATTPISEEQ